MRSYTLLAGAAAVVSAQTLTGPPMGVYQTEAAQPLVTATTVVGAAATAAAAIVKRADSSCLAQPTGIAHVTVPDTVDAFAADTFYSAAALAAGTPAGYNLIQTNTNASYISGTYVGYTLMDTYDVASCAKQCDTIDACSSFNVYYERDPSVNPDSDSCSNPAGITHIKCVWWAGLITPSVGTNDGQWRNQFHVVIAGSNAYSAPQVKSVAVKAAATTVAVGSGGNYAIYFSSDSTQGSFSSASAAASYLDCNTACDNTDSCTAYTYVGADNGAGSGTCWLKAGLGSATKSGLNVISGVKVSGDAVASTSSAAVTTTSASKSTTTSASKSTTTSASKSTTTSKASTTVPTTMATSTKTSTTSSAAATSTSWVIKLDGTGTFMDGYFMMGTPQGLGITSDKNMATRWISDSAGRIVTSNYDYVTPGYALSYPTSANGAWVKGQVNTLNKSGVTYEVCKTDGIISCQGNGVNHWAGVCKTDGYVWVYLGLYEQMPSSCKWVGLYKTAL